MKSQFLTPFGGLGANYLKIALRNLLKNKVYSFINIAGLALGLAVSMLIILFVSHEISFDKFHKNQVNIFQVGGIAKMGEHEFHLSNMSERLGDALKEATSSVKEVGRKCDQLDNTLETDPKHRYNEAKMVFVDEGFFKIFDFKILAGDAASLTRPYTIMLTPEMALKYFGKQNPIGKTLKWNKETNLQVTGIVEKNPSNSSIEFDFVGSLATILAVNKAQYPQYFTPEKLSKIGPGYTETFLLLDNPKNQSNVAAVLGRLASQNPDNENISFVVNHFSSGYLGLDADKTSDRAKYVYIFSGIAALILLLALINFMNLTTARTTTRAKEVGVRKSIGANQRSLATQFYVESTLTILISLVVGLVLFQLLQPIFYQILDLKIDTSFLLNPYFYGASTAVFVATILLSGSYPTFVLSKFNPVEVLKGKIKSKDNFSIRQVLTVFQLSVSVGLIFCSMVIFNQVKQMRNKNIGLNKDQMLIINLDKKSNAKNQALINQIEQIKGVEGVSGSKHRMFYEGYNMNGITKVGEKDENKSVPTIIMAVDGKYADLYQMDWKIKPKIMPSDLKNKIILNESAAKKLDPNIASIKDVDMGEPLPFEVIGIVKDFNYTSAKRIIEPMMLRLIPDSQQFDYLNIKINKSADVSAMVEAVQKAYNAYKTEDAFAYHFVDDSFDKLFKAEDRIASMFGVFTAIAIFIACLGLFGLVTFTAEQRTKEIGIRKVLGASVMSITAMLSKDFLKLVIVGIVIASPLAYFAMKNWLQDFAFRIEIEWWIFVVTGVMAIFIALLTVGYQAIKAALMNPVESLKTE
ncbi:MAG: ABC transporter permease [Runella slithyformis]|nr:MAG: ABC transporter permease [Runella slithyformis]TAF81045.1 MAG: ABC transporter permease [Runella slithyformis]